MDHSDKTVSIGLKRVNKDSLFFREMDDNGIIAIEDGAFPDSIVNL